MYRSSGWWVAVAVGAILFAQAGCDGGGRGTAPTPGEYFRRNQAPTVTPNGRIELPTVKEVGGEIRYETEDGKWLTETAAGNDRPDTEVED